MVAVCCSRVRRWSNSRMTFPVVVSRFPVGSSARRRRGEWISARGMDQCAGNCHPLHLAPGKLVRKAIAKTIEFYPREALAYRFACGRFSRQKEGQFHVFENREGVKQLKGLKNETDFFAA